MRPFRSSWRCATTAWGETGVLSREIRLTNRGGRPLARRAGCPASAGSFPVATTPFAICGGAGDRSGSWRRRRWQQGRGDSSRPGGARPTATCPGSRSRNRTLGIEYIAELAWSGNWWMQVERQPGTGAAALRDQPVQVGLGMHHDFGGPLTLLPGDTITLPRAVFTATAGDLDDAANQMHRYQRGYLVPRVATQSAAAGAVQYVVSPGAGGQHRQHHAARRTRRPRSAPRCTCWTRGGTPAATGSGPWATTSPIPTSSRAASRSWPSHVHDKGMKFGLWVEIENAGIESRLFREHPEWCLPYGGKPWITAHRCQLDFANPAVRQWATCHRRPPGAPVSARLDQDRLQHRCGRSIRSGAERTVGPPAATTT